jgi:hypothetical protein
MPPSKYVRPTVWVPPAVSAVLQPQPPLAPSIPPAHVVDLMTEAGSVALGARWRVKEARIVECPALTNSRPEFKTTYDIEPHAELLGFEVWINGAMPRTPGRPSPGAIQGFNMPNRVVLADGAVSPGDRFEIAVFAINGPISAAPGNFLFVREAKIEFFR